MFSVNFSIPPGIRTHNPTVPRQSIDEGGRPRRTKSLSRKLRKPSRGIYAYARRSIDEPTKPGSQAAQPSPRPARGPAARLHYAASLRTLPATPSTAPPVTPAVLPAPAPSAPPSSSSTPSAPSAAAPASAAAALAPPTGAPRPLLRYRLAGRPPPFGRHRGRLRRRLLLAAAPFAAAVPVALGPFGGGGGVLPEGILARAFPELLIVLFVRYLLVPEFLVPE